MRRADGLVARRGCQTTRVKREVFGKTGPRRGRGDECIRIAASRWLARFDGGHLDAAVQKVNERELSAARQLLHRDVLQSPRHFRLYAEFMRCLLAIAELAHIVTSHLREDHKRLQIRTFGAGVIMIVAP